MTLLSHSFKVRHLILAAVLTTSLGFVNYANAQTAQAHRSFLVDLDSRTAVDLGNLIGRGGVGATGINDAGQVVGGSGTVGGYAHAFITGPNGMGMRDLGTLGGRWSYAYGINDAGQVVGYSNMADNNNHAFISGPDGVGMRDLGTLLGGDGSRANGINDIGQVVGYSYKADNYDHAFITGPDGEGMTDLNSLVDLPQGTVIVQAMDINNSGQVIAIAIPAAIPEPEAMP